MSKPKFCHSLLKLTLQLKLAESTPWYRLLRARNANSSSAHVGLPSILINVKKLQKN